jgi:hypothetical protein
VAVGSLEVHGVENISRKGILISFKIFTVNRQETSRNAKHYCNRLLSSDMRIRKEEDLAGESHCR